MTLKKKLRPTLWQSAQNCKTHGCKKRTVKSHCINGRENGPGYLKQSRDGSEGVPEERGKVRNNFALLAQLLVPMLLNFFPSSPTLQQRPYF
jgi:hypothetical protein